MSEGNERTDLKPPSSYIALAGAISVGVSALLYEHALFIGLGTAVGVVLFSLLYGGWHWIEGGRTQGAVEERA